MTLQQIHYVLAIAETGSMNRAAESLFISQPALTKALRELEAEIGITVFRRSSRGVIPTDEGSEFLTNARQLYQQYDLIMERYTAPGSMKRLKGAVHAYRDNRSEPFDTAQRQGKGHPLRNDQ